MTAQTLYDISTPSEAGRVLTYRGSLLPTHHPANLTIKLNFRLLYRGGIAWTSSMVRRALDA